MTKFDKNYLEHYLTPITERSQGGRYRCVKCGIYVDFSEQSSWPYIKVHKTNIEISSHLIILTCNEEIIKNIIE